MSNTMRWVFVGDLQMPFHSRRGVDLFFKVMKSWKPDVIDVVGDIDDQLEYSTFSDGTTDEFFARLKKKSADSIKEHDKWERSERIYDPKTDTITPLEPQVFDDNPLPFIKENALAAREFYGALRAQHPDAEIHNSLGNHDIRIFKYIDKKAPYYKDEVTPNMLWGLDDLGITYRPYDLPPLERHAGIYVHHGATTSTTGLAVKSDIETYNVSLVRGHDHRGGVVYKSYPIPNQVLVGMGTGHLCDPSQYGLRYTINPSWEMGFGIAHVTDGVPMLQFINITPDFKCVVDGVLFAA